MDIFMQELMNEVKLELGSAPLLFALAFLLCLVACHAWCCNASNAVPSEEGADLIDDETDLSVRPGLEPVGDSLYGRDVRRIGLGCNRSDIEDDEASSWSEEDESIFSGYGGDEQVLAVGRAAGRVCSASRTNRSSAGRQEKQPTRSSNARARRG